MLSISDKSITASLTLYNNTPLKIKGNCSQNPSHSKVIYKTFSNYFVKFNFTIFLTMSSINWKIAVNKTTWETRRYF